MEGRSNVCSLDFGMFKGAEAAERFLLPRGDSPLTDGSGMCGRLQPDSHMHDQIRYATVINVYH